MSYDTKINPSGFAKFTDVSVGDRVKLDDDMLVIPGGEYEVVAHPKSNEKCVKHEETYFFLDGQRDNPEGIMIGVWKV